MKYIALIVISVLLGGCCSLCPKETQTIYVDVPCKQPATVSEPPLKVPLLTVSANSKQVIEAYVFDHLELMKYSEQLRSALSPYKSRCTAN